MNQVIENEPNSPVPAGTSRSDVSSAHQRGTFDSFGEKVLQQARRKRNVEATELHRDILDLRHQVRSGVKFSDIMLDAFALACESIYRTHGFDLHHVQILGGSVMAKNAIAEMQTGEGKTLTAVLPAVLYSLAGKGVHVVTVNDYLADRDATELRPIYERLGLTVGCVTTDMEDEERRQAYSRDITYGTAKEMGFDFLRDRLRLGADNL